MGKGARFVALEVLSIDLFGLRPFFLRFLVIDMMHRAVWRIDLAPNRFSTYGLVVIVGEIYLVALALDLDADFTVEVTLQMV